MVADNPVLYRPEMYRRKVKRDDRCQDILLKKWIVGMLFQVRVVYVSDIRREEGWRSDGDVGVCGVAKDPEQK